jgi:preprotein translocase subunit SecA
MRIFGGEQISALMGKLKLPEDQPIENKLVTKVIEQAQSKVEGFHFDIRKRLVEYDDVANQQREIVYGLRRRVLGSENLKDEILEKLDNQVDKIILTSWYEDEPKPDYEKVVLGLMEIIPFDDKSRLEIKKRIEKISDKEELRKFLIDLIHDLHKKREKELGESVMRQVEKYAYLGSIDRHWIDHIDYLDSLRESVGLRAYGQRDPLVEFKNEAYNLFERLVERINDEIARRIFRIGVAIPQPEIPLETAKTNIDERDQIGLVAETADQVAREGRPAFDRSTQTLAEAASGNSASQPIKYKKLGRNDPCWCGSGKKWKKCHYPQAG